MVIYVRYGILKLQMYDKVASLLLTPPQGYFAPEVLTLPLKSSPFEGKSPAEAATRPSYDCKADIWSAGVVCFEILTGRAPFAADSSASVLRVRLDIETVHV